MAFLKSQKDLPNLKLCGNNLPWVTSGKHLGVTLVNKNDGLKQDMKMKRAQYIARNNEIAQEFQFCHPFAQFHLNQVYNSSFTGSPLWNLFCKESEMIEKSWNTSFRVMFGLPVNTHRFFIQPVSGKVHVKNTLMKRFLGFLIQIEKSCKLPSTHLLEIIKHDVRSTTGANLRNIMLLLGKDKVEDIKIRDINDVVYATLKPEDSWKVEMLKEIIEILNDELRLENLTAEEICYTMNYICTV